MSGRTIRRRRRDHPHGVPTVASMLHTCLGCGERGVHHFVPPSFGQIGFYLCNPPADITNHTRCKPPWNHEHEDHFDIRLLRR